MNQINLTGNICNDLELKTTPSEKQVCSFNLAVKRPFTKDTTDFIPIVCWNKQAENLCKYCTKGSKIAVSGTLTSRIYEDKEGKNRTVFEILANEVEFLGKKTDGQSNAETMAPDTTINNTASSTDEFITVNDDDLPF